jgi:hypothetical protein
MVPADSSKVFTSYAGLEVRIIAHSFKVKSGVKVELDRKYPNNIFRDDHMRAQITNYIFTNQQQALEASLKKKSADQPDLKAAKA